MAETGTYVVTHADGGGTVLRDVDSGQVHAIADDTDLEAGEAVRAVLESGAIGVTWSVVNVSERWTPTVTVAEGDPPAAAREAVAGRDPGDVAVLDDGEGELHAIPVPGDAAAAAEEVAADPATRDRAAQLGARRVVVRAGEGLVSVRYR